MILDLRRLLCPMPVIKVQNAMAKLLPGEQLQAICTDPGALHDIPTWCRINGHEVLSIERKDREIYFSIKVGKTN